MSSPLRSGSDVVDPWLERAMSSLPVDTSTGRYVRVRRARVRFTLVSDGAWHTEALSVLGEHRERG